MGIALVVSLVSVAGLAIFCTWAVVSLDRGRR
jgi:hypothetical protein